MRKEIVQIKDKITNQLWLPVFVEEPAIERYVVNFAMTMSEQVKSFKEEDYSLIRIGYALEDNGTTKIITGEQSEVEIQTYIDIWKERYKAIGGTK